MKPKVLLYNRMMNSLCRSARITGLGGEFIGDTTFDGSRGFHVLELPLEVYEKHAKALSETSNMAMRRWEPHFVVVGECPIPEVSDAAGGVDFNSLHDQAMARTKGMTSEEQLAIPDQFPTAQIVEVARIIGAPDDLAVPFFALKKIAKTEGVDISACEGMDGIRVAIRKHRELVPV